MVEYKTIKVDIGPESSFTKLPAQVDVGDWSYFLAKTKKGMYQLLSTVCPHAMGEVVDFGTSLCARTTAGGLRRPRVFCINGPNSRMTSFPVAVESGATHRHRA